jgi:hypothetical protein
VFSSEAELLETVVFAVSAPLARKNHRIGGWFETQKIVLDANCKIQIAICATDRTLKNWSERVVRPYGLIFGEHPMSTLDLDVVHIVVTSLNPCLSSADAAENTTSKQAHPVKMPPQSSSEFPCGTT